MSRTKETRYVLANNWQPNTAEFNGAFDGMNFDGARLVRIHGNMVKDGRAVELLMTPARARSIAEGLLRIADQVEKAGQ